MASNAGYSEVLPASVLRNLSDKLYDKRKNAAIEVEQAVKEMANSLKVQSQSRETSVNDLKVNSVVKILTEDYALSPHANYRKGGLIGLAAVTVGLSSNRELLEQQLSKIVPPVLHSFTDQDSRVRYYACESLYNIAKASRESFVKFFTSVFDSLCKLSADSDPNVQNAAHLLDRLVKDIVTESSSFDIENFIPQLREGMTAINPYVRQFLVGWITVLHSVPDIDMIVYLPNILDGLLNMLADSNKEIRQQVDQALAELMLDIKSGNSEATNYGKISEILVGRARNPDVLTKLKSISWIKEFVDLTEAELMPYFPSILGAILPSLSHADGMIRDVALQTNKALLTLDTEAYAEIFDVPASVAALCRACADGGEALSSTEALGWMAVLLKRHRKGTISCLGMIQTTVLDAVSDENDGVVSAALNVFAVIAADKSYLRDLMTALLEKFRGSSGRHLLGLRGAFIVRGLAKLIGPELAFREAAAILDDEQDPKFATDMVQALNLILLTAPELIDLRSLIQLSLMSEEGANLFVALYNCWCHNSVAAISLCLLAQAYRHSATIIREINEADVTPSMLAQLDRLVHLIESPIFVSLRLQLLQSEHNAALLESLFGILMLLPQTSAFEILRNRLQSSPGNVMLSAQVNSNGKGHCKNKTQASTSLNDNVTFAEMLSQFNTKKQMQRSLLRKNNFIKEEQDCNYS